MTPQLLAQLRSACASAQQAALRHLLGGLRPDAEERQEVVRLAAEGPPWAEELVLLVVLLPCAEFEGPLGRILQSGDAQAQHTAVYRIGGWTSHPAYAHRQEFLLSLLDPLMDSQEPVLAFDAALAVGRTSDSPRAWKCAAAALLREEGMPKGAASPFFSDLGESVTLLPQDERLKILGELQRLRGA